VDRILQGSTGTCIILKHFVHLLRYCRSFPDLHIKSYVKGAVGRAREKEEGGGGGVPPMCGTVLHGCRRSP